MRIMRMQWKGRLGNGKNAKTSFAFEFDGVGEVRFLDPYHITP